MKDLAGQTPESFLDGASRDRDGVAPGGAVPATPGRGVDVSGGQWYALQLPRRRPAPSRADALDVEVLQQRVLGAAAQRRAIRAPTSASTSSAASAARPSSSGWSTSGKAAVAFSMFPVSIGDLMAIADAGGIMPPKSTWFEPKLRDGLLVHLI